MTNLEIAKQLSDIGDMLEILDNPKDTFRIIAYHNAARKVEMMSEELEDVYGKKGVKGLRGVSGIGESIANSIEKLLTKGKISYREELIKKVPRAIVEFTKIPGVGPKTALKLFKDYYVDSIKALKRVIMNDKSEKFFPAKTKDNILVGIRDLSQLTGRMLLSFAEPIAREVVETLRNYPEVEKADMVGSLRRMKETVGDIDIVACAKLKNLKVKNNVIIGKFIKEPFVEEVILHGNTKATVIHKKGTQIDLEILPTDQYGSLLQHFTGSKDHNIHLRTWAEKHGFSLSEHGIKVLSKSKRLELIKCDTEGKVYKTLGMQTPIPEMREDRGEIELALKHQLPKDIIELKNIKADLHLHSTWSEGEKTISEMAEACQKLGYNYCAITDHTAGLGITHGLKEKDIPRYMREIKNQNQKIKNFKILSGAEVNIMADGKLDIPDAGLEKLDLVIASIHSGFRQSKEKITARLLKAINNPHVDIIGHPSGRLIERRQPLEIDWDQVFQTAAKTGTIMEINAQPDRLDLNDDLIILAKKYGVKFVISTDSHHLAHLENMRYGVATAHRGWLEQKDVLNTLSLDKFQIYLKQAR